MCESKLDLTIDVTADHIKNGKRKHFGDCPVSLAVASSARKLFPDQLIEVSTFYNSIGFLVVSGDVRFMYISHDTKSIKQFVKDFDAGLPVQPFTETITFTLRNLT